MAIQSSISELGLIDLFQLLYLQRKTGRLIISDGPEGMQARVLFVEGAVGFASTYERVPKNTVALLVEWEVLGPDDFNRVDDSLRKYDSLSACLDGEGVVSTSYLSSIIASRTQRYIYELFKWNKGICRFTEMGEIDEKVDIIVSLNTENLILEGARQIDEWENITSKVPSPYSVFKICTSNDDGQKLNLKPKEWEILSLIDGKCSVREASEAVSCDLFTTSKLIYGLVVMDVIELVESRSGGVDTGDLVRKVDALVEQGIKHFAAGELEKAASEFEKAIQIDPSCFDAMRMLGEIYYKMNRLSEATVYLKKTRAANPDNEKAIFISGQLYARLGEVALAMEEWDELRKKSSSEEIVEMMEKNIRIAKKWRRVLQKY
jgi:hypothetical protein